MKDGPCPKDCPGRHGATKESPRSCHADCEIYREYWAGKRQEDRDRQLQSVTTLMSGMARSRELKRRRDERYRRNNPRVRG